MPLRTAFKKCPHAVFLAVDFSAYGEYSRKIRSILREYSELVEPMSLDEAFLDVSHRPEEPVALAEEIRRRIKAETGLTASIGIGPNKLLAKIACGMRKPDAVTEINAETAVDQLRALPSTVLWGVGPKTAARLEAALGVRTVGDLQGLALEVLQEHLGPRHGEDLYHVCRGEDDSPIVTEWEPKSLSRETTYQVDARVRDTVIKTIDELAADVTEELRDDGYRGRTVTVKIRYRDFKTHTRAQTLPSPTDDDFTIRTTAVALLDRFTMDRPVRLVGVRVSSLSRTASAQSTPSPQSQDSGSSSGQEDGGDGGDGETGKAQSVSGLSSE